LSGNPTNQSRQLIANPNCQNGAAVAFIAATRLSEASIESCHLPLDCIEPNCEFVGHATN